MFPLSSRETKQGSCMCSIVTQASRSSRSKSEPYRKAIYPARRRRRLNPFRSFHLHSHPSTFRLNDAWGPTPADREACKEAIGKLRNEGIFTPPSMQGTLAVPGNLGGMNWSGYAFDPLRNLLIVNTNNLIGRVRLIPRDKVSSDQEDGEYGSQRGTPYGMLRRFLQSPSDLPCGAPPWGTLTAVDMAKGTIRWQIPLGSMQDFGGAHGSVPPGIHQPRRPNHHRRRPCVHSRHNRLAYPGIQCRERERALECGLASCRKCYPDDIRDQWQTIPGYCGGRASENS